jgi:hypothetical protein
MRACARVALASIAVSASINLSGCAAVEELKETFLRWVESQKLPSGGDVSADQLPQATPAVPPENTPKEPSNRPPHPKHAARKLQRQTGVLPPMKPRIPNSTEAVVLPPKKPPIPDSTERVRPEGTEGQSAPSKPTPRWLPSRFPEAPPPGRFSR